MGAPAIAAIMRRREREIVDDFRAAGATSTAAAQSYTAVGLGESMALKRLRNRAVIREASPGKYYLDEEVWAAVRRLRQRMATVIVSLLVLVMIGVLLGIIKS
ncbi:MAG: hypothetical protein ACJ8AJ_09525 [Gemmatimonadaceae bacterium]